MNILSLQKSSTDYILNLNDVYLGLDISDYIQNGNNVTIFRASYIKNEEGDDLTIL